MQKLLLENWLCSLAHFLVLPDDYSLKLFALSEAIHYSFCVVMLRDLLWFLFILLCYGSFYCFRFIWGFDVIKARIVGFLGDQCLASCARLRRLLILKN